MSRLVEVIVGCVVGGLVALAVVLPDVWAANERADLYRSQVDRVRRMCAVRVSDQYAECKPGALLAPTTTTSAVSR